MQSLPSDPAVAAGYATKGGATFLAAVRGADASGAEKALGATLKDGTKSGFDAIRERYAAF